MTNRNYANLNAHSPRTKQTRPAEQLKSRPQPFRREYERENQLERNDRRQFQNRNQKEINLRDNLKKQNKINEKRLERIKRQEYDYRENQRRKHNSPDINRFRHGVQPNQITPSAQPISRIRDSTYKEQKQVEKVFQKTQPEKDKFQIQEQQQYLRLQDKLTGVINLLTSGKLKIQQRLQRMQARLVKQRRQQEENKLNSLKSFLPQVPADAQLRELDPNPYSPAHNIYYVSELVQTFTNIKSMARDHLMTSLMIFNKLANTVFQTDEEAQNCQLDLPRRLGYENKKTVIFDLDETLIHCNDALVPPYDVKLSITFPTGEVADAGINIRPYAREILQKLHKDFQVIVFTASHSCYANVVIDHLDPQGKYIHHRIYRESCYQTREGMYCKDLRVINRDLSQMVLVDNAAYSYSAQLDNGIPIISYLHGKHDYELKALEKYLMELLTVSDVRVKNRATFHLDRYKDYLNEPERLVKELYLEEYDQ